MPFYPVLQVECGPDNLPLIVIRQGLSWTVLEWLECWQDTGCWWDGESAKMFYRVLLADQSIREIFYDQTEQTWHLYKTYD